MGELAPYRSPRPQWKGYTGTWLVKHYPYIQCDLCVWRSRAKRTDPYVVAEAAFRRHADQHEKNDRLYQGRHRAPGSDRRK